MSGPRAGTTVGAVVNFGSTMRLRDTASVTSSTSHGIQVSNLSAVNINGNTVHGNGPGAFGVQCFSTSPMTASAATLTGNLAGLYALTREPLVVFTSNVFAILGLRSLYFLLGGAVEKFYLLRYGLATVLVFVGMKMVWLDGVYDGHFPIGVSLAIIACVITASIGGSLLFPKCAGRGPCAPGGPRTPGPRANDEPSPAQTVGPFWIAAASLPGTRRPSPA